MIKKTFALTLSLSVSAQLAAQTETDYLSGMTPIIRILFSSSLTTPDTGICLEKAN